MARKKKAAAKENAERWLLTYADLITLLMVFFVLLFSMSTINATKFQALAGSLQRAFNVNVTTAQQTNPIATSSGSAPINVLEQQNFGSINQIIQQFATTNNVPSNQISAQITKEGIAITISGVLLFYNGTNQIKPDGITLLQQLGPTLANIPNAIRVEGHTDNVPISSPIYPTNWELSAARAVAVTRYLAEVENIAPNRLSAVGFGQYQPIVPNDTRAHQEMNRRAVIVILYGSGGSAGGAPTVTSTATGSPGATPGVTPTP